MGDHRVERRDLHDAGRGTGRLILLLAGILRSRPGRLAAAALLLGSGGCGDGWLHEGADGTARVQIVVEQVSAGAGAAFDAADNLAVAIDAPSGPLFSGSVPVNAAGGAIESRIQVPLPDGSVQATLTVAVRRGADDLFLGAAGVQLAPGETSTVTLSLTPVVGGLVLTPPPRFTAFGQTADLEGAVVFATGDEVPGAEVVWQSLDPGVLEVLPTSTGYRAVARADGTAALRGSYGGESATVAAEVQAVVVEVEVTPSSADLAPGQTIDLVALLRDAGGTLIPGRSPVWSSSALGVATVSSTGTVTGVALGSADIRATSGGVSGTATVTVRSPGPAVTTLDPVGVTTSGAILRASVSSAGRSTNLVFEYGSDPGFAQPLRTPPVSVPGSATGVEVTRAISGLADNATYYVRAVASNADGTVVGNVISFTTLDAPNAPSGLTGAYTGGVRLSWQDNSGDEVRFEVERELFTTSPGPPAATPAGPARVFQPLGSVGANVTTFDDATPPTGQLRYRVRACSATACSDWSPSLTWYFGLPPRVQTRAPTNVGFDDADLSASVNPLNGPTSVYWEVAFEPTFTTPPPVMYPTNPLAAGSGNVDVLRTTVANFLQPDADYYVRAVAVNPWGTTIGNVIGFRTQSGG